VKVYEEYWAISKKKKNQARKLKAFLFMVRRMFSMYYFKEKIFNISYFRKRNYVCDNQEISQMLSHFIDHTMIDQVVALHLHKCSSNDQYLTIYFISMLYFHKVLILNHTKYMVYVCLQGLRMLKSNGSYLYGDIRGIFFKLFTSII
jgi:hypothetical protein